MLIWFSAFPGVCRCVRRPLQIHALSVSLVLLYSFPIRFEINTLLSSFRYLTGNKLELSISMINNPWLESAKPSTSYFQIPKACEFCADAPAQFWACWLHLWSWAGKDRHAAVWVQYIMMSVYSLCFSIPVLPPQLETAWASLDFSSNPKSCFLEAFPFQVVSEVSLGWSVDV